MDWSVREVSDFHLDVRSLWVGCRGWLTASAPTEEGQTWLWVRAVAVLATISARILDGRQTQVCRHSHDHAGIPPAKNQPAAKIHPWGCRDLSNLLLMMGFG